MTLRIQSPAHPDRTEEPLLLRLEDGGLRRSSAMLSSNERVSAVNEGRVSMPWRHRLYLAVEAAVRAAMAAAAARVMAGGGAE